MLSLSFPCASPYKVGELTNFLGNGSASGQVHIEALSDLLVSLLMASVYLFVLLRISPWLLLAAVALAVVITTLQQTLDVREQGLPLMYAVLCVVKTHTSCLSL